MASTATATAANTSSSSSSTHHKRSCSIHKVRELKLQEVTLDHDYQILRMVGEGTYGKVHLAEHRQTGYKIALKAVGKDRTKIRDFLREFHYSYFLSPHRNILNSFDVAFQTDAYFLFAQEYTPFGDLAGLLDDATVTLDETKVKLICRQVASALEFMHSKELVHRDVRPHNILVFNKEASVIKVTDFGLTRLVGTLVKRSEACLAYMPPEICEALRDEGYTVELSSDVWQLAILVLLCLARRLPWQRADITDANFTDFAQWQKRKSTKTPSVLKTFTPRLSRMLRRMLEPKAANRSTVKEIYKYLNDRWLLKGQEGRPPSKERSSKSEGGGSGANEGGVGDANNQRNGGAPEYTSKDRNDTLGKLLNSYGIETTIDYEKKKKRIHEWILSASP